MISWTKKVLFLSNPWIIGLVKISINYNENCIDRKSKFLHLYSLTSRFIGKSACIDMLPIPKERRDITEGSTFKRESEINWHATSWLKKPKRQTNKQIEKNRYTKHDI